MYQLSGSHVASWRQESSLHVPAAIDVACPSCGRLVTFAVPKWTAAPQNTRIGVVTCPACHRPSAFFLLDHLGKAGQLAEGERLFLNRRPAGREPLPSILTNDDLAEPIQRAYLSAINVFNAQEWIATAVLTRRLLEGVTKSLLPDEHQSLPLARQVAMLPEKKDLSEPITTIADAIRKGGNLGAHFDLEVEPNREVAQLMLELSEELLEYFFVLPARIQELHDRIEQLGNRDS